MTKVIGIGKQSFEDIIQSNCFYIDKTSLIKEWWESEDDITLITRPRRFGKTLNMDMLITRVSKESIFSDLNNLKVVTTTSEEYATCFGFTEEEVFAALEEFELADQKDAVKQWYDGFTFGSQQDIYNPWSITNYLKEKKLLAYWASTSSNGLINRLIQTSKPDVKEFMEELLNEREIVLNFDEQIVFDQLETKENAIWSLMVASGYLKVDKIEYRGILHVPWYHLKITNLETLGMFSEMFAGSI